MPNQSEKPSELTSEEKKAMDDQQERMLFLAKAKRWLMGAQDARRRYDYEWMVRDMFRRGYHFSKYMPNSQTVVLASRQSAKIPINLMAAQLRSIRNQAVAFRPKWVIGPRYQTEESKTQARYSQQLLDYLFDHLNLKKRIKERRNYTSFKWD